MSDMSAKVEMQHRTRWQTAREAARGNGLSYVVGVNRRAWPARRRLIWCNPDSYTTTWRRPGSCHAL